MSTLTAGYLIVGVILSLFAIGTACLIIDSILNKDNNSFYTSSKTYAPPSAGVDIDSTSLIDLDIYSDFDSNIT